LVFGALIGIAFFLIVIVFTVTFFSTFFENVFAFIEEFFDIQANKADNRLGSTVCDLRFQLWGAFDEAPFGFGFETQQRMWLGVASPNSGGSVFHPEVAKATFQDCYTKTSGFQLQSVTPALTGFDSDKLNSFGQTLAFTNALNPLIFEVSYEIIRVDDNRSLGTRTNIVNERQLADLPHTFSTGVATFSNIELTRYNVEITCSGDCTKINELASGEPFVFKIRLG